VRAVVTRGIGAWAITLAMAASGARAQSTPQHCAELKAAAERYEAEERFALLNETLRLRAAECPTAAAFFEAGIALIRVNAVVGPGDEQGTVARRDQRLLLAMSYLEEALRRKDPPLTERDAAVADYHIQKLQQSLVLVRLVPSNVHERYTVELDGEAVALSADRFWCAPGKHTLVFSPKAEGYAPFVPQLPVLSAGETHAVVVRPLPAAAEHDHGPVVDTQERKVPTVPPKAGVGSRRIAQYATFGLGGGLVVASVATAGARVYYDSHLEDVCPTKATCPPEREADVQRAGRLATTSIVTGVAGGLAMAGAAVWYLLTPSKGENSKSQVELQPVVSQQDMGMVIRGAF
jgi:hypothetical protein